MWAGITRRVPQASASWVERAASWGTLKELSTGGRADVEIFEVAFGTAYFNYTNRVAEGLGVEPETE